jgi:serine/threonine-protein kinase ATR
MTSALLDLCDHPVKEGKVWLSMRKDFPRLHKMLPSKLIIPLQESLTAYIPIHIVTRDHQPFPTEAPFFQGVSCLDPITSSQLTCHG